MILLIAEFVIFNSVKEADGSFIEVTQELDIFSVFSLEYFSISTVNAGLVTLLPLQNAVLAKLICLTSE